MKENNGIDTKLRICYLVIEKLDFTLSDVIDEFGFPLSDEDINRIAYQIISLLEQLTKRRICHRDLNPSNIMFNYETPTITYLIDYCNVDLIHDKRTKTQPRKNYNINSEYSSPLIDEGETYTPYDDLISLAYIIVKLYKGDLYWSNLDITLNIAETKQKTTVEEICEGLPDNVSQFFRMLQDTSGNNPPYKKYLELFNAFDIDKSFDFVYLLLLLFIDGSDVS